MTYIKNISGISHTRVEVTVLPDCDFCGEVATYDGKTKQGPWGAMCSVCFVRHGIGLGLGKGQQLILKAKHD